MNHLVSVRTNIMYKKVKEEYKKYFELILLVDKPSYKKTNDGEAIRERGIDEQRFIVSEEAYDKLIEMLKEIRIAKDDDLQ
jgi:hypothetical protein